ncbi:MAG: TFIIB-type zinc finger domain-containing protein [Promethearchaeota archaeon]
MQPSKILSRILIVFGILCLVIGFISIFFLQITHGEISLQESHTSGSFHLEKGKSYSISASGSNYPFGSSGGFLVFYLSDGTPVVNLSIHFSFNGDSTSEEVILGDFQVPLSGDYYFHYFEAHNTLYNTQVKLRVQESMIEHYLGINSIELIFLGILIAIVGGLILPWVGRIVRHRRLTPKKESEPIESSSNSFADSDTISCPNCGYLDEGFYCSNCGTQLRRVD